MKKLSINYYFFLFCLLAIAGCKKDENGPSTSSNTQPVRDAILKGDIITPSGTHVAGAMVYYAGDSTITDAVGKFEFQVRSGSFEVIIQTGRGKVFQSRFMLNTQSGKTVELTGQQKILQQVGAMAYIEGGYDAIQHLIDSLGYNATSITVSDLSNITVLAGYRALFLNCGKNPGEPLDSLKYSNLLSFLYNCGSIYASDWSVEYLTGDGHFRSAGNSNLYLKNDHAISESVVVTQCISPDIGGFIADSLLCTLKSGQSQTVTGAMIVDPALVAAMGQNTVDIHYDLASWAVISQYGAPFTPIITDPTLGVLAVKSDYFGKGGGRIYYTTFHNEPQSVISPDIEEILNYFILHL